MKYPKVSIVVPTYNRENYLKECLDSIIKQNYPSLEIIVTDDNSKDDTEKLVKNYMAKYPFIKYVKNSKYPQGPNGNKNNGLDYCSGEIIGIFDDDDTMVDGALKMMVNKLLEGYDVVMANCKIISNRWDNGQLSGYGIDKSGEVKWKDYLCGKFFGEHWILFKKNILNDIRFNTDTYGREGILFKKIFKNKKIFYLHKVVRNYRIHNNSVIHTIMKHTSRMVKNYEVEIYSFGDEMKRECPCYLSSLYKDATYFSKLSGQYIKSFKYIFKSILLCPKYKNAYIMFIVLFLPKKIIPYLSKIRVYFKSQLR